MRIGVIEIERKRECLHYNRSLQISWVIIGKREGSTNFIIFITYQSSFVNVQLKSDPIDGGNWREHQQHGN